MHICNSLLQYLGARTTDKVKTKCIELMYSWQKGLPNETKMLEAYTMLKNQGIVKEDPTYMDQVMPNKKICVFRVTRPVFRVTRPVFRVTRPYLNLLVKPSIFSGKNLILCILKGEMPFKMHKIIYFFQKQDFS